MATAEQKKKLGLKNSSAKTMETGEHFLERPNVSLA